MLAYDSAAVLGLTAIALLYRIRAYYATRVPAQGPLLVVANHQSFLDPLIVGTPLLGRRHMDFVARIGLFTNPIFGRMITTFNSIAIRQDEPDAPAIREVLRRLKQGRAMVVFAEGSRSVDGRIAPFKRGTAVLVRRARCPVLPVALEGASDIWPPSRRAPKLFGGRVMVQYGHPIEPAALLRQSPDAMLERLRTQIDTMRLELRARMREDTHGRYPPPGPADTPSTEALADESNLNSAMGIPPV